MVASCLAVYVLSEDAGAGEGEYVHRTWVALLRRMLRIVDPACDTQPACVAFEQPEPGVREVMAGNQWRVRRRNHPARVHFWRVIADRLQEGCVVVFHVDGDVSWAAQADSETVADVERIARARLRDVLLERNATDCAALMRCFVAVHPFYEVEAWLFQNTPVLRRLCEGRPDLWPRINAWEQDRARLDGLEKPKREMPFMARHNRELAEEAFPAEAVFAAEGSFHHAVLALDGCPAVRAGLAATHAADRFR